MILLDDVDHALGQRMLRAAGDEEADADRGDLRTGCRSAHPSAEQAIAGRDARDVRAVRAGDDPDVDEEGRRVGLNHERHRLPNRSGRVVDAEVAEVVVDLVVGHRRLAGEAAVVVRVDPDLVVRLAPEDREVLAADAVPVQVGAAGDAVLAARSETRLDHAGDAVRAVGAYSRVVHGNAAEDDVERAGGDVHGRDHVHVAPRRVAVGQRIGVRDPVDDLPLAGARRLEARVVQIDSRVEDPDRDPAAIPVVMVLDELRGLRVARRHVRIARGVSAPGGGCGSTGWAPAGRGSIERDDPVHVDRLDAGKPGCSIGLRKWDLDAHVAEPVVSVRLSADARHAAGDRGPCRASESRRAARPSRRRAPPWTQATHGRAS